MFNKLIHLCLLYIIIGCSLNDKKSCKQVYDKNSVRAYVCKELENDFYYESKIFNNNRLINKKDEIFSGEFCVLKQFDSEIIDDSTQLYLSIIQFRPVFYKNKMLYNREKSSMTVVRDSAWIEGNIICLKLNKLLFL